MVAKKVLWHCAIMLIYAKYYENGIAGIIFFHQKMSNQYFSNCKKKKKKGGGEGEPLQISKGHAKNTMLGPSGSPCALLKC